MKNKKKLYAASAVAGAAAGAAIYKKKHNKKSPFLIGDFQKDDIIKEAKQVSYLDKQLSLF